MDRPITQYPSLRPRHSRQRETPLLEESRRVTAQSFQQLVNIPAVTPPCHPAGVLSKVLEYISIDLIPATVHPTY